MSGFDLRALVSALDGRGVAYVVIGGVAVTAHGYVRATRALDVVPDPDPENLKRLAEALLALEAELPLAAGSRFDHARDLGRLTKRENMTVDTREGAIDIVQRSPGVPGYETLSERAVETEVLGVPVRICSLADLRAMKTVSGRAQDRADLENLPAEKA